MAVSGCQLASGLGNLTDTLFSFSSLLSPVITMPSIISLLVKVNSLLREPSILRRYWPWEYGRKPRHPSSKMFRLSNKLLDVSSTALQVNNLPEPPPSYSVTDSSQSLAAAAIATSSMALVGIPLPYRALVR